MDTHTQQPEGRSMQEIRRLVAEDERRWRALGQLWNDLTENEQRELIATAKAMLGVKQA